LDPPPTDVLIQAREREEASVRGWRETERREREREVAVGTEREEPRGVVIRVRWSFIHQERGVALGLPVGRYGRCSNEL
jgi:hypothetical protein